MGQQVYNTSNYLISLTYDLMRIPFLPANTNEESGRMAHVNLAERQKEIKVRVWCRISAELRLPPR